jgi:hypothetical protein
MNLFQLFRCDDRRDRFFPYAIFLFYGMLTGVEPPVAIESQKLRLTILVKFGHIFTALVKKWNSKNPGRIGSRSLRISVRGANRKNFGNRHEQGRYDHPREDFGFLPSGYGSRS